VSNVPLTLRTPSKLLRARYSRYVSSWQSAPVETATL
jgi:hypothetical protein